MIETKDILKMATHVFKRGQGVYDKRTMHPTREWFLGLFIFSVVVILGGIQSTYSFSRYQNLNTDGGQFSQSMVQFNASLAEKAIALYTKRKEAFTALQVSAQLQKPVENKTASSSASSTKPVVKNGTSSVSNTVLIAN